MFRNLHTPHLWRGLNRINKDWRRSVKFSLPKLLGGANINIFTNVGTLFQSQISDQEAHLVKVSRHQRYLAQY